MLLLALFGWAQGFISGRAGARRAGARRLDRHADRPAAAVGRLAVARTRRCSACSARCSSARCWPGCSRPSARRSGAPSRAMPGVRRRRRAARRGARRRAPGSGVVWILGALAVQSGGYRMREEVQRSAILQRLNTILPPSGPLLNSLRALDPFPRIDGPEARRRAAARRDRARPGRAGGGRRAWCKVLGTACGLGVEGSGWVARRRARGHERARRGGPGRHARAARRPRARARRRRRSTSTRATTSRCCASTGSTRRPLPLADDAARGHVGGDPRLPAQRARSTCAPGALGATRRGALRRTPTGAGRCGGR